MKLGEMVPQYLVTTRKSQAWYKIVSENKNDLILYDSYNMTHIV